MIKDATKVRATISRPVIFDSPICVSKITLAELNTITQALKHNKAQNLALCVECIGAMRQAHT